MFRGKDCCSLAVTIGTGMNLRPIILLHSTRKNYQLGLLSLTKYNLSLVMGFLHEEVWWQAVLLSSRAKKYFVAPTSTPLSPFPPPPPSPLTPPRSLKFTIPFSLLRLGPWCFSVLGLCSVVLMLSTLFSRFCFFLFSFISHFHVALTSVEASRRAKGKEGDTVGAAPLSFSLP
jgi:hypothetical protein